MSSNNLNIDPKTYLQMGYTQKEVKQAYTLASQRKIDIFDALQIIQNQSQSPFQSPNKNSNINSSKLPGYLQPIKSFKSRQYEIVFSKKGDRNNMLLKQQVREANIPVGLLNISNCCYLNSLLQCYFLLSDFVTEILIANPLDNLNTITDSKIKIKRIQNQYRLLNVLKDTFSYMAMSSKKYLDPQPVLKNLVDSVGQKISYGQQKDLFEINLQIIDRLNQCLYHTKKNYQQKGQQQQDQFNHIKKLFYGVKVQFFQDESENISDFLGIIINSKHQNLSIAINQQFHYEVQIQEKISKRHTYIRQVPQYLFFYINRMEFDRQGKEAIKAEDQMSFEFQIYLDRFMQKYKESQQVNSPAIQKLLNEKSKILNQIKHLDLFVIKMSQCRAHASFIEGLSDKLPSQNMTDQLKQKLKKRLQEIEEQLQKIQSRKEKYVLIYIFVHRGDAKSGHYWGYGRNVNEWVRFDVNCKKISKDKIFKDMQKSAGTPYALVYSKQQKIPKISYEHYLDKPEINVFNYLKNIPEPIQTKICMENRQLMDSAIKRNEIIAIQGTVMDYKSRYNIVKTIFEDSEIDNKFKLPHYGNFALYLYSKGQKQLSKYNIFALSLKKASNMNSSDLLSNQSFLKGIQTNFRKKVKGQMKLKHFSIQNQAKQHQRYDNYYKNFLKQRKCIRMFGGISKLINKQNAKQENFKEELRKIVNQIYELIMKTKTQNRNQQKSYVQNILYQLNILLIFKLSKYQSIDMKILQRFKQKQPLIISQIKLLKGINHQNQIFIEQQMKENEQIDFKLRDTIWKIEDVKKTSLSQQLQDALNQILEILGEELKMYKNIVKNKKLLNEAHSNNNDKSSIEKEKQQSSEKNSNKQDFQQTENKTQNNTQQLLSINQKEKEQQLKQQKNESQKIQHQKQKKEEEYQSLI